jgi:hypothetical protein
VAPVALCVQGPEFQLFEHTVGIWHINEHGVNVCLMVTVSLVKKPHFKGKSKRVWMTCAWADRSYEGLLFEHQVNYATQVKEPVSNV